MSLRSKVTRGVEDAAWQTARPGFVNTAVFRLGNSFSEIAPQLQLPRSLRAAMVTA